VVFEGQLNMSMRKLARAPAKTALSYFCTPDLSLAAEHQALICPLNQRLLRQACAMAPVGSQSVLAQKRPLSMLEDDVHPSKKRRQSYQRHHSLHNKPQIVPLAEPAIVEQQSLDKLLVDAIKVICEEQGARRGVQNPVIESLALEAFRNATEECL